MEFNRNFDKLDKNEKIDELIKLRDYCTTLDDKNNTFGISVLRKLYPLTRNFPIEIEGYENIPDKNVLFLINHSNSHDFILSQEIMNKLGRDASAIVASDSVDFFTNKIFTMNDSVAIDRNSKEEANTGMYKLSKKIINGKDGIIFGESTWNLHPTKLMHNLRLGPAKIATLSNVEVVPTIFEYVDVNDICTKEKELYTKCVIRFGKPIKVSLNNDLISNTNNIQNEMINLRRDVRRDLGIKKDTLEDIKKEEYINHLYLKKFDALGIEFDSDYELSFIYFKDGEDKVNEYHLDKQKRLVPGTLYKNNR